VFLGAPNLNLSIEEKRVYGLLFRQADTESVGVVTGEIAVQFFEKTRLDSRILGEVSRFLFSLRYCQQLPTISIHGLEYY
jgi:hypothetical protein